MRARSAAPEGDLAATSGHGDINSGRAAIIPLPAHNLPPATLGRLQGAGIHSCQDWQRLSRTQKNSIWGITKAWAAVVDRLVAAAIAEARE